ncbi:hypothetical protein EIN_180010 [Entamoeba invadens IP1]|uniref:hypothetical protein n=1 Tax=Entamoeba invadens IP1 TaxID=370355 RepID=UPI0002C3E472|nr:hypothetical protein EIN_180010 [Entamoeba invadens IP1]ELP93944.1 hypothetical protein EIN_180010 [Entamoeba invadens IP1]|eukprot:XP_004260715.1 hypothetical protein EIN_180010 [Entamoeba invadens IP1]
MSRLRSNTRNSNDVETIASWSEEEQQTLDQNLLTYPADSYSEFKRLALLLTNLPTKRLRDVSLRLQFMKAFDENKSLTWDDFIKSTMSPRPKGEKYRKDSPTHSGKCSPRTPRSCRELTDSPLESPRYKKPPTFKQKIIPPPQPTIQQCVKAPQKLIDDNNKILDKLDRSVGQNKNFEFKDFVMFYSNCTAILDATKTVGLPVMTQCPIRISEADIEARTTPRSVTGSVSFQIGHVPRLVMASGKLYNTQPVQQQVYYIDQQPNQLQTIQQPIQNTPIITTVLRRNQDMMYEGSQTQPAELSTQQGQMFEQIEDYQQDGGDSFINGSFGGYGLTVSSLNSH